MLPENDRSVVVRGHRGSVPGFMVASHAISIVVYKEEAYHQPLT